MTIPKHDEIRVPALSLLVERGQLKLKEFEAPLAKHFGLPPPASAWRCVNAVCPNTSFQGGGLASGGALRILQQAP